MVPNQYKQIHILSPIVIAGLVITGLASCSPGEDYGGGWKQIDACSFISSLATIKAAGENELDEEHSMDGGTSAEALARIWLDYWNQGTPDDIPLAENFKHTSPFGCVEGRKKYLDWVKPLSAKNTVDLKIQRIISGPNQAVVHFEMETPSGIIPAADWVVVSGDKIVEVHSFYDASLLRK